jgi:hypothetical protein
MDPGLTLNRVRERHLALSNVSSLEAHTLLLNPDELKEAAAVSSPVRGLHVSLVHPGESARINRVLDVLEPRSKIERPGAVFPGIATEESECGSGVTVALDGVAYTEDRRATVLTSEG